MVRSKREKEERPSNQTEIAELKAMVQELSAGWQRSTADFENYKRRQAYNQATLARAELKKLALDILPVIDGFDRSQRYLPKELEENQFIKGLLLTGRQLKDALLKFAIREIEIKIGDQCDPIYHEAISKIKSDQEEDAIVEVVETGYLIDDQVLRPAKVVVSKGKTLSSPDISEKKQP